MYPVISMTRLILFHHILSPQKMKTDTKKQSDVRSERWEDMMMMMTTPELWMMKTLPEEEDCASISHQRALLSLETAPCEGQNPPLLLDHS